MSLPLCPSFPPPIVSNQPQLPNHPTGPNNHQQSSRQPLQPPLQSTHTNSASFSQPTLYSTNTPSWALPPTTQSEISATNQHQQYRQPIHTQQQPQQQPPQPPQPKLQQPIAPWSNTLTLNGHVGPVLTICLNEAGSHVLSGGQDRTVRLWNPRNQNSQKNLLTTFNDGRITHAIADIAVLPGSKQFVTCGGTTRALLWDLNTKQLTRKFNGHSLRVNCVEQGAFGEVLLTGGYDRLVVAHDLRTRNEIQTLPKCKDSVESLAVVDQDIIASDANGCVYTFDIRTGTLRTDEYHAPIGHLCISPDSRCIALSCQDGKVRLVERATGLLLSEFQGEHVTTDFKIGCAFVDHGRVVVTGSEDGKIVMYDTLTEKIHGILVSSNDNNQEPERTAVCTLGSSRDYGFLISGSYDGSIKVWSPSSSSK